MNLAYAVFTGQRSGIIFSIIPASKGFVLTVLAPSDHVKYVSRITEEYGGERVDDVKTGETNYACFEVRMMTPTLTETAEAVRAMFASTNTGRTTYYYAAEPNGEPTFILEPVDEAQFLVRMPQQPPSFTGKFTQRARGRHRITRCTVVKDEKAVAHLQLEVGVDEVPILNRLADLYEELASAA
jgi:hypothetical protein